VKVVNDGFDLGAQRNTISQNNIPAALTILSSFSNGSTCSSQEIDVHHVKKTDILTTSDLTLSAERFRTKNLHTNCSYPLVNLGEIADFKRGPFGGSLKKEIFVREGYKVYEQKHAIRNDFGIGSYYITKDKFEEMKDFAISPGDFIISCSGTMGRIAIVPNNFKPGIINQALLKLTPNSSKIVPLYLKYLLESNHIQKGYFQDTNGVAIQNVASVKVLKGIKIPLPSLEIQQQIVSELSQYQKVNDGARMVVEHYRPYIKIESNWPFKPLSEVCIVNPKKSEINGLKPSTPVSFVPMSCVRENDPAFTPESTKPIAEVIKGYTYFKERDLLLAKITPCFENGKAGIAEKLENKIGFGSTEFHVLRATEAVLPEWIYHFVTTADFRTSGKLRMTGSAGQQRVPSSFVEEYQIPVPSIRVQQKAIEHTLRERLAVTQNEILVEHMRHRIDMKLSEIWGDK